MRTLIGMGAILLTVFLPHSGRAALGEPEETVAAEAQLLKGSVKSTERTNYRIHEIQLPSGTLLREFAAPGGAVFAVAWTGPSIPNLQQALGSYFDVYISAAKAKHAGHRHLEIRQSGFVMQSGGHMRAFAGRAYLPQGLPRHFRGRVALMHSATRGLSGGLVSLLILCAAACGGGGSSVTSSSGASSSSSVTASNVVPVVVDGGPTSTSDSVNTLFTTVTFCVPGTTDCQTIDHIQVDTGSYGLRILAPVLTLSLPVSLVSNGNSLAECTQFVDGYSWGPVATADVQISGETARSVPVQIIGKTDFAPVPADCASTGTAEDTVATFGANGILGIGVFAQDCGAPCATNSNEGFYYACSATQCVGTEAPLTSQVLNPVPLFATDNNGTIIDLPTVAAAGAATVTGSLIFGIDTESNNASGHETVLTVDPNFGTFTIVFNGQSLTQSFIDSGTNGIFFNDNDIAQCTGQDYSGFYCPSSIQNLSATLTGVNGVSTTASFSVGNAQTLFTDNPTFAALPTLAGTYSSSTDTFDWGLAFYYGRRVVTAIQGYTTSVGTGPYIAF